MPMSRKTIALVFSRGNNQAIKRKLMEELDRKGIQAVETDDGDPILLASDGVILAGDISKLKSTSRLLAQNKAARPRTIVWAYEPIIPNDFAGWTNRWAARTIALTQCSKRYTKPVRRLTRLLLLPVSMFGTGPWGRSLTAKELQFSYSYSLALKAGLADEWIDAVACSTEEKRDTVSAWGVPTAFAPLSVDWKPNYHASQDQPRNIDVLFLGRLSNWRRTARLMLLASKLRRRGYSVKIVTHGLRGQDRDAALDKTRVLLHLTKYPWDTAWMRFYMASSHGVAVVSETLSKPKPLRPGHDYGTADASRLETEILRLLQDETARQSCVFNCRETIAAHMSFAQSVTAMIDLLGIAKTRKRDVC